jgi:hypothetical protein
MASSNSTHSRTARKSSLVNALSNKTDGPTLGDRAASKIEAQRDRIFQAMSMIATVNKVLDRDGEVDDEWDEHPLWYALRGVHGLLNDIAGELDSVSLRRAEVAHG